MDALLIGKLLKPHGLKGQIRGMFYIDDIKDLKSFTAFYFKDKKNSSGFSEIFFDELLERDNGIVVKVKGCDDRSAADVLQGLEIYADSAEVPKLKKGSYYIKDLIDCEVLMEGAPFAKVVNLIDITGRKMLVLRKDKTDIAVPFSDEYIGEVNTVKRFVEARPAVKVLL